MARVGAPRIAQWEQNVTKHVDADVGLHDAVEFDLLHIVMLSAGPVRV
jgi:hypothetical protein